MTDNEEYPSFTCAEPSCTAQVAMPHERCAQHCLSGGILRVTPELLHDLLLLPDTVRITAARMAATLLAQDQQDVELVLEGIPMPGLIGDRLPEVQAVYGRITTPDGGSAVFEKFQRFDDKRGEWVTLE